MTQILKINDKFKKHLFPLSTSEFETLENNILTEGIKDPIIIWGDNYIIDGHNRYEIAIKHKLSFSTTTIKGLYTEEDVLSWMDNHQLGRRNLTDFQRDIIIGRLFNSIKNRQGKTGENIERSDVKLSKTTGLSTGTINRAARTFNQLESIKSRDIKLWDMLVNEIVVINKNDIDIISNNLDIVNKSIEMGDNLKNIKNIVKRELNSKIDITGINVQLESIVENIDAVSFLRKLDNDVIDLVVTDPPFGIDFVATRNVGNEEFNDGKDETFNLLDEVCKELVRVTEDNCHLYFFSGYTYLHEFKTIISKYFTVQDNPLIWVKNNHTMCNFQMKYANKYEFIIFATKGKKPLNNNISTDILEFDKPTGKIHDCEKPIDLLQYLIENSSQPGDVVCDPFGGSLSTYRASIGSNRKCYTCEKDETIFKIAINNL